MKMIKCNYKIFVVLLPLLGFLVQTFLVYFDSTGYKFRPLSIYAIKGKQVWMNNNCQTCHQIYGFGGFLGPDLTNKCQDYSSFLLKKILLIGPKNMPIFYLSDKEVFFLLEYFKEINKTGKSQNIYRGIFSIYDIPWFVYVI